MYRRSPRYTVIGDRKRPQNTAYLEFPRKSNLVISTQNITNFRAILQVLLSFYLGWSVRKGFPVHKYKCYYGPFPYCSHGCDGDSITLHPSSIEEPYTANGPKDAAYVCVWAHTTITTATETEGRILSAVPCSRVSAAACAYRHGCSSA